MMRPRFLNVTSYKLFLSKLLIILLVPAHRMSSNPNYSKLSFVIKSSSFDTLISFVTSMNPELIDEAYISEPILSLSKTVTSYPLSFNVIAVDKPHIPAPITTIFFYLFYFILSLLLIF
jgi:hypothetical protein